jgi:hypothetical protein
MQASKSSNSTIYVSICCKPYLPHVFSDHTRHIFTYSRLCVVYTLKFYAESLTSGQTVVYCDWWHLTILINSPRHIGSGIYEFL